MDTGTTMIMPKVHQGKNIRRFRDILGIKQETLAEELSISQQAVSKLEQKEEIDSETLSKVAGVLKIPVEAIKNLSDEGAINFVANSFHDNSSSSGIKYVFNPIEKIIELYERLLEAERTKNR